MSHRFTFLAVLLLTYSPLFSQKHYIASAGEMIFSVGTVQAGDADIWPVLRWSPVFNFQQQVHFDFTKSFGIYSGLGLRNVGLISKIEYEFADDVGNSYEKQVTIKERSYDLSLPLLMKLGSLDEETYFAAGAEAEMMFAYKRKIMDGDQKLKVYRWFDDRLNIFNPSVLAEIHFAEGFYFRFKYYLKDFLNYKGLTLIDGTELPEYGEKSPLFYVSFGSVKIQNKKKHETNTEVESAFFSE